MGPVSNRHTLRGFADPFGLVVDPIADIYSVAPGEIDFRRRKIDLARPRFTGIMTTLDTSAFVGKFVEEARVRLKALGQAMLRLEQAQAANASADGDETIRDAMREAHSLKGAALMLGFSDMSEISHQLEDLFVACRRSPLLLDGDAFDLMLAAVAMLSARVEQLARGVTEPSEISELSRHLTAMIARFQVSDAQ